MTQWIEVKVRHTKRLDNGKEAKVTEPYLVDALSCTEAEAIVMDELSPLYPDLNVLSASKTKISEISEHGSPEGRFYKVKVNFIPPDEKTAAEKRTAVYVIVQAGSFDGALRSFHAHMKGTLADFEIEAITETRIVEVFHHAPASPATPADSPPPTTTPSPTATPNPSTSASRSLRAIKNIRDSVPEGTRLSMSVTTSGGSPGIPETVIADKTRKRGGD